MRRFAFRYALQVTDWTYKMSFRISYSFAFFLCKQKRKKHTATVNLIWWKYSAYHSNFSLCNTPHLDPNTHNHFQLLDTNGLVVFQSWNINTYISSLCLVDANLLSPHRFFTVLQDLQTMMHYSFMFFLPFPHFCLSVTLLWVKAKTWSLSIGQVFQYNPVPPMDCWMVRVDLREANCWWIHSRTAVSAPVTHFSASSFLRSCSACICPFALTT